MDYLLDCRTLMLVLGVMVAVTSHPNTSMVYKRAIGTGTDNRVGSSAQAPGGLFTTPNGTVVTAQTGGTATLPCSIKKHFTAVVTWIRKRDHHLLTVGASTYSHDARFLVRHARHVPAAWPLLVRRVLRDDEGLYECQLSVHPPDSIFVLLRVVEAYADVEGAPDLHVRSGSELRLVCILQDATEPPSYVFWYHGERMINYDATRGVRVAQLGVGGLQSELRVPSAGLPDAGNYSCVPSNARPATVTVHVHADAACPPTGNGSRTGPETGLIVQCPLATKDRQDVQSASSSAWAPLARLGGLLGLVRTAFLALLGVFVYH